MSWDWDTEDIDLDEDNGRIWVLIMPKTLAGEAGDKAEATLPMARVENNTLEARRENRQMMAMYVVADGSEGPVQASLPVLQLIGMPVIGPTVII